MAERSYYDILGVSRSASQDEIKKAYRRLARQYHPDLHTGSRKAEMEKKFKELNEANEVLGDPETRKKYDQYGPRWREAEAYERARREAGAGMGAGMEGGGGFTAGEGQDFGDLFESLFGQGARGQTGFRGFAMPGADLEASVSVTLREVLTGVTRRLELAEPVPCKTCGGTGRVSGRPCNACGGTGTQVEPRQIEVKIPAGVQDEVLLRVPGKGDVGSRGGKRGNLYLRVHIQPDRIFRRHGDDLHVILPVWPWEAALGAEVVAPTLSDQVRVKIPPGSRSGSKLRLKGKGLPSQSGGRGDQYLILQIDIPSTMSDEERKLYEQLSRLPHPDPRVDLLREARSS
jgi:DnaJ-class molecular chaperone